jgi:hypothetical protein
MALLSARSELFALLTWLCCPELLEAHQGPVLCDVLERNALSLEPSERHRMLGRVAWFGHPERA